MIFIFSPSKHTIKRSHDKIQTETLVKKSNIDISKKSNIDIFCVVNI